MERCAIQLLVSFFSCIIIDLVSLLTSAYIGALKVQCVEFSDI